MCKAAVLSDRAVIDVGGADARDFLHGIITNDMKAAQDGKALHAGLLTPQGKMLFDFFVCPVGEGTDEHFLLDCPAAAKEEFVKRLTFYRLRARVGITDLADELQVVAVWDGEPQDAGGEAFADPRLAELGSRVIAAKDAETGCETADEAEYHAHRLALGVPEGGRDFTFGEIFPHEANFDQLNGVDFKKGCYVGQEVVSRMQHKTVVRKRIVPVEGSAALPAAGTEIRVGDFPIGTLGSSSGTHGLALIRLDRAEKAINDGRALLADGIEITLKKPRWANFEVPAAASNPAD